MPTRLILMPDGKFGLFSTVSDRIWAIDCTEADVINIWKAKAARSAEDEMRQWLKEAKERGTAAGGCMSLEEALQEHVFLHPGDSAALEESRVFDEALRKMCPEETKPQRGWVFLSEDDNEVGFAPPDAYHNAAEAVEKFGREYAGHFVVAFRDCTGYLNVCADEARSEDFD